MKMDEIDREQRLAALAQLGDNTACEELFTMNKEKIFNLAYRYTGNFQDAEDVLQETFSRAFLSIGRYRPRSDARFSTWLYRIGINCSLNFLKKHKHRLNQAAPAEDAFGNPVLDSVPCDKADPEKTAVLREMQEALNAGLDLLSPKQRMIFVLKHHEGLKTREIADLMKCSDGSVKKQLHRAMSTLAKSISLHALPVPGGENGCQEVNQKVNQKVTKSRNEGE